MRAEEKRQQARHQKKKRKLSRKGRRGRLTTADKVKLAERTEKVFPEGVPQQDCQLSHTRPVWRLEKGRAVLVAYQIYRGPSNQYGKIPGVLGRSEFGLEIVVEIAYFVYVIGLSFDKVCLMLQFLQNLPLGKTQADSLAAAIVTALAARVRRAVHAAGQLVGGACRRNELEHQQRVGLSFGEGTACCSLACTRMRRRSKKILDPRHVRRHGDQRRCGGVCQL